MNSFESISSEWTVAIFAARESAPELAETIRAVEEASRSTQTTIDVLVNGNPTLAIEVTKQIEDSPPDRLSRATRIRIWDIPLGGKAHAWNQYVHVIWPRSRLAFFVDGYASVDSSSFKLLASEIGARRDAIGGTGVCLSGRGAQSLKESTLAGGGIQGALFVLTEKLMHSFRDRKFDLPQGLYGFDTLLGAILAFGGDPSQYSWDAKRFIASHPQAVFTVRRKNWWNYSNLKTQINRILNNALRKLVLEATKYYFLKQRLAPEVLPKTIEGFVMKWVNDHPIPHNS